MPAWESSSHSGQSWGSEPFRGLTRTLAREPDPIAHFHRPLPLLPLTSLSPSGCLAGTSDRSSLVRAGWFFDERTVATQGCGPSYPRSCCKGARGIHHAGGPGPLPGSSLESALEDIARGGLDTEEERNRARRAGRVQASLPAARRHRLFPRDRVASSRGAVSLCPGGGERLGPPQSSQLPVGQLDHTARGGIPCIGLILSDRWMASTWGVSRCP